MKININQEVIFVSGEKEETKRLGDILSLNKKTLLYFYPKDNTFGCMLEAYDFSQFLKNFQSLGINIVGVSKDGIISHKKFIKNHNLSISLIADTELHLHQDFGVLGEKKLYGKTYIGTIRSTFLLDRDGNILKEWRNVKAKGHGEKVLGEV